MPIHRNHYLFPPKKKYRIARLGEHPLYENSLKGGGGRFLHSKNFPPHSKNANTTGIEDFHP